MFIEDLRAKMRASLCRGLLCKQPRRSFDWVTVTTMSYKNPHQSQPAVVENAPGMFTPCKELKKIKHTEGVEAKKALSFIDYFNSTQYLHHISTSVNLC